MKIHKVLQLLLLLIACWNFAAPALAKDSKPNILVIFGDDVGWMNVSSYGSDIMGVKPPNIDRLAQEGLRLSSYYAQIGKTLEGSQSQILNIQHTHQAGR
jgi:arylsulfatase